MKSIIGIWWMHDTYNFASFQSLGTFLQYNKNYKIIGYVEKCGYENMCFHFGNIDKCLIRKRFNHVNFCKTDIESLEKYCYDNFIDLKKEK